jgi:hypothetical protein
MTKGQKRIVEKGLKYARENRIQPKTKKEIRMVATIQRSLILILFFLSLAAATKLILTLYI